MGKIFLKIKNFLEKDVMISPFLVRFGYVVGTALVLLALAFYNGYPLVFSDTGSYIESSLRLVTANERPLGYGYFIRLVSFHGSLWMVILVQAVILNYLLLRVVQLIFQKNIYRIHLGLVVFLTFFTSVSWFTSQVMPDIIVAMMVLAIFVLLAESKKWYEEFFLYLILFLSFSVHFANFLIFLGMMILGAGFLVWKKSIYMKLKLAGLWRKMFVCVALILLALGVMVALNWRDHKKMVLNPASHIFMMSRLNESGILDEILARDCPEADYVFCYYKRPYPQHDGFIWDQKSPINILGWFNVKGDSDAIIHRAFTTPSYLLKFVADSAVRSVKMGFYDGLDSFDPYLVNTSTYRQITKGYPQELVAYKNARQYNQNFVVRDFAAVFYLVMTVAALFFLVLFGMRFLGNKFSVNEQLLFLFVGGGVFANAVVLATLSGNYDRYNSRIIWLLPMLVVIFLVNWRAQEH